MRQTITIALRVTAVTLVLTGILYPLVATGMAQLLFPWQAAGSIITGEKGHAVGSALIAQGFVKPWYFRPRPSVAGDHGFDATASSGSNLGPTSRKLRERVQTDIDRLHEENPDATDPVPVELVTTSASGLDPHLSPAAALWQVSRVAQGSRRGPRAGQSPRRVADRRAAKPARRAAGQRAAAEPGARSAARASPPMRVLQVARSSCELQPRLICRQRRVFGARRRCAQVREASSSCTVQCQSASEASWPGRAFRHNE